MSKLESRLGTVLDGLHGAGQYKHLRVIDSPMDARVRVRMPDGAVREVLCFCSNNYLGLANHPEVVEAGHKGLKDYGAGTASVRFICGTFAPHEEAERQIARLMGTEAAYTFVSAWTAAEALFPTLCEPGDMIVSDELNHACIIDAIRLTTVIKKGVHKSVYKNNDLAGLEARLQEARANKDVTGVVWVVTDGVFSMEGSIADLPKMRALCDAYDAVLVVDDSHGHGVMGERGRGTHEHWGMVDGLGTPTLRVGHSVLEELSCNPRHSNRPSGFIGKDPYPPGTHGPAASLIASRRLLPHLRLPGATYFVSWRCVEGVTLSVEERAMALRALTHFDGERARVYAACVMPDHVHWIVRPFEGQDLPDLQEGVKRFAAKEINAARGRTGRLWEAEGFDHIVRDGGAFAEFVGYVINNPVEAGLVATAAAYDATFVHADVLGDAKPHSESGGTQSKNQPHSESGGTQGRVDIFTGTLGKALGGAAGGFVAGSKRVCEMLVQRGRPTLFSNALPVTVACSAAKAIEILLREPQRVQRLRDNVKYARQTIGAAGFNVLASPTAICPIIVHDTAKAIAMSKRLLELGVFVIGFGYPVVPEGHARLRLQVSAAHSREDIDALVGALKRL
ncbi:MAG: aminotransferase class I/II-fold pyridoxal phosphate-dependent enzyme [Phycisphaerales bacterium]